MPIGYHIPFEGFNNTLVTAINLGLPTYQMFIRNNRNLKMRSFSQEDYDRFNALLPNSGIDKIVVHASYAMNPCSGDEGKRSNAISIIKKDLQVLQPLSGNKYYVLHPGCHTEYSRQDCIRNLIQTIKEVTPYAKGTKFCVETMAGEGTELMSSVNELLLLCFMLNDVDCFGLCLDTCHLFGAGIDAIDLLNKLKQCGYLDKIGVIHVNGSKKPFGSRLDNHGSLQRGYLSLEDNIKFLNALKREGLNLPCILESEESAMLSDWLALTSRVNF